MTPSKGPDHSPPNVLDSAEKFNGAVDDPERARQLVEQCLTEAGHLIFRRRHDRAIELLERVHGLVPEDPRLRRQLALALGGKAELTMGRAEQLRIRPAVALLAEIETILGRAIETDQTLADPYWDMAVVKARFHDDFETAQRYLSQALQLRYQHPKLLALTNLIEQGLAGGAAPGNRSPSSEGETELRQLILRLIEEGPEKPGFDSYCRKAIDLVRAGRVCLTIFQRVRQDCRNLQGDDIDYATDLLRVLSAEFHDPAVLTEATEEHLRILAQISFAARAQLDRDPQSLHRGRRIARRGLKIVEQSDVHIDPNVRADLLLALGQTFSHPSDYHLGEAILHYKQALVLKEAANNLDDVKRPKDLLRQIISYQVQRAHFAPDMPLIGGLGEVLDDLEIAYEAAQGLADPALVVDVGLALSLISREVQQPSEAEAVLRQILALPSLSDQDQVHAKFELASALSEQQRPAEAAEIQTALLSDANAVPEPARRASLWMSLGNSRREMGDLVGAREAFETALKTLPPPKPNVVRTQEGKTLALLGQLEFLEGRPEAGQDYFERAAELLSLPVGTEYLHFHSLATRCYFKAGMRDRALSTLDKARYISLPVAEGAVAFGLGKHAPAVELSRRLRR